MTRPKKKTRKERTKITMDELRDGLFEIETEPPPPGRKVNEETILFQAKMKRTLEKVGRGQAFKIPKSKKNAAKKYLQEFHKGEKFRMFKIAGNPNMLRVYKMKTERQQIA